MDYITRVVNGLKTIMAVGSVIFVLGDVCTDKNVMANANKTVVLPILAPNLCNSFEQVCLITSHYTLLSRPNVITASCDNTISGTELEGQPIQILLKSGGHYSI